MDSDLTSRLRAAFVWQDNAKADPTGWWRDGDLLRDIATALARLHEATPTVVAGVASRGLLLGPLVARELGVGFAEIRKDTKDEGEHGFGVLRRTTPPDYVQRDLTLTLRRGVLRARDRVLLVDDWIETGAQATAAERLVADSEAELVGTAVVVDATTADVRRRLHVRSLMHVRQLPV